MSAQLSEGAEPDLTPLLDMVFQLITFFMLVVNFKGAALDTSLQLPVLGSARPLEWKGDREPLMLNVDNQGRVPRYARKMNDRNRGTRRILASNIEFTLPAPQENTLAGKAGQEP